MPQGDKSAYTDKQKRKAEHIEEGYEDRGVPEGEAERRAWATVNAMDHGGKKGGSGRGTRVNKAPARKGGRKGGRATARKTTARTASARKTTARTTSARTTAARTTTARKTSGRKTSGRKTAGRKAAGRTSKKR
jgi:plasmid stabilization system protein ParE